MVRLHIIGITQDLKGVLVSGRRGGKKAHYWISVDDDLWEALETIQRAKLDSNHDPKDLSGPTPATLARMSRGAAPTNPTMSSLSPAQVQAELKSGKSVKAVAQAAGVDEAWVERFAGPVRQEMAGVIELTKNAFQERSRKGKSALPIGRAVIRNLESKRATPETMAALEDNWDARRQKGQWKVRLRISHRGSRRSAEWLFDKETREAQPLNDFAREIGWWGGARVAAPRKSQSRKSQSPKSAAKAKPGTASKKKPTAKKATSKKAAPKKSGAKKPASKRTGARKTSSKRRSR